MSNQFKAKPRPRWHSRFPGTGNWGPLTYQQRMIAFRMQQPDSLERREAEHRRKIREEA